MNLRHFLAPVFSAFACAVFAPVTRAAVDAHQPTLMEKYALEFIQNRTDVSGLDAYLDDELGLPKGDVREAVRENAQRMLALKTQGYVVGKRAFWDALSAGGVAAPGLPKTDVPVKPDPAAEAVKLWVVGRESLAELPQGERDFFLRYNLRKTAGEENSAVTFNFAQLNDKAKPRALKETPGTPDERADKLLVRLGYDKIQKASENGGPAPTEVQADAVAIYGSAVVETPPARDLDVILRNRGISITTGAGVILPRNGGDGASTGSVLARWNWFQRHATARWNQRVSDSVEGDRQVPYLGQIEYAIPGRKGVSDVPYAKVLDQGGFLRDLLLDPTFCGPILGSTLVGQKIAVPGGAAGDTERPYLVGWGLGFSYYKEAAPLVYIDVAQTVSPQKGFKGSSTYVGVSFDAIVFEQIWKGIRGSASP